MSPRMYGAVKKSEDMRIELDVNDDLLPEYDLDFSRSKTNHYAAKYNELTVTITLDADVANDFPTSESVDNALRKYTRTIKPPIPKIRAR